MLQVLLFDRLCWWWSGYFLISIFHVLGVTLSIIWRRMSRHEKCWSKSPVVSIVGISPRLQVVIPLLLSQIIIIIIRIIIIIWGRTFGHTSVGVTHVTCWIKHTQKETTFASYHKYLLIYNITSWDMQAMFEEWIGEKAHNVGYIIISWLFRAAVMHGFTGPRVCCHYAVSCNVRGHNGDNLRN